MLALRQPPIKFVASTQIIEIGGLRKRQIAFNDVQRIVCVHHYRKRTIRGDHPYNKFVVNLRHGKPLFLGRLDGQAMDSRTQLVRKWLTQIPSSRFRIDEITDR